MCPPEKSQDSAPFGVRQSILCSPFCEDNIAKLGDFRLQRTPRNLDNAVFAAW
jgi:hypothetical protein